MFEVRVNWPRQWSSGVRVDSDIYYLHTWKEALDKAVEKATETPQGKWIDVYTPAGTHIAHIMGMT